MSRAVWLSLALALTAQAAGPPDAKLVIDFAADRPDNAWVAAAFQENAYRDLAGRKLAVLDADALDRGECPSREAACLVERYAAAGADIIVLGWLKEGRLQLEVYEGWLKTRVARETFELDGRTSLVEVRHHTLRAVSPFFESGGLLEKRASILRDAAGGPARDAWPSPFALGALALIAIVLLTPIVLRRRALLLVPVVVAAGVRWLPVRFDLLIDQLGWALPMIGGSAWGWLVLLNLRLALPTLPGLGGVRHGNVGRLVRAWCAASAMRCALLAVFQGALALALALITQGALAPELAWMLLIPAFGLLLHFSLLAVVDRLARRLDRQLVIGSAAPENPWHPVIKKYFMGYVRRVGLQIDRAALDRTLFLPGATDGIVSYGGGLAPARIVIKESLLERALHPLVDEPLFDGGDDGMEALDLGDPRGVLLPVDDDAPKKRRWHRTGPQRPAARRRLARPLLGQNETLLGYLVPQPAGESVPLVIDDPDEYSVLRELLTAHYAAFDRGLYGEEADDTDPTQKDFLFGALLREVGGVLRQDTLLFTLTRSLAIRMFSAPAWMRAVHGLIAAGYDRFLARGPAIVADGYVALNRGLDHLIQYLFLVRAAPTP